MLIDDLVGEDVIFKIAGEERAFVGVLKRSLGAFYEFEVTAGMVRGPLLVGKQWLVWVRPYKLVGVEK